MSQTDHPRKTYPSDLTDEQWAIVEPLIPPPKSSPRGGRPRQVERHEVLNTLLYLNRSGCQWDMLPHDLLPTSTVYDDFAQWRDDGTWAKIVTALRERTRVAAGREPTPSAACIDSQSVKTTELGGPERGYDGGKNIKGRKRHVLVETLGVLLAVLITSAGLDDGVAAPLLRSQVTPQVYPRLRTIFADQQYHNHPLDAWMTEHRASWRIEVKARPAGMRGFTPLEKRWVIERTNAWHGRYRRNSKDYERSIDSSTAMIQISHIHLGSCWIPGSWRGTRCPDLFQPPRGVQQLQVHSKNVVDEAQGDDTVREWRWPEGRPCPCGEAKRVINRGLDDQEPARPRDACSACETRVDDLTDTLCAGPHQPLKVWIWCRYFRGLHGSTEPMAAEREWDRSEVHEMPTPRREGLVKTSQTSRDLERWSATQSLWWRVPQAIRWPWQRRDEQVVGIG